jgi:uncharacterized protein (TIGR02680 family)
MHESAQRLLRGRRLNEYLASELRGMLLATGAALEIHHGLAGACRTDVYRRGRAADASGARARIDRTRIDEQAARAQVEALASSPAMQDAQALRRARTAAESAAADVAQGEAAQERRKGAVQRRETDLAQARDLAAVAERAFIEGRERSRQAAVIAGVARRHDEIVAAGDAGIVSALEGLRDERRRALRHLRGLSELVNQAERSLAQAEDRVRGFEGDTEEAVEAQRTAAAEVSVSAQGLFEAYRTWATGARLLTPPSADELVDAFTVWTESPAGPSPLRAAAANSLAAALERLARSSAVAEGRLDFVKARLADLRAERDRLAGGEHRPPLVPPTRDPSARLLRDGAPFWRLVDFAAGISAERCAGLEAALEAAGILDAWVTPDGRLLGPDENDVLLVASGPALAAQDLPAPHLGTVLQPAVDRDDARAAQVTHDAIRALLEQIGLGLETAAPSAVDDQGHFRLGPLDGRWHKPAAEHIGEGARQAARHRRLQELADLIESGVTEEGMEELSIAALRAETIAAQAEGAAVPDDQPVRVAVAELETRSRALQIVRGRLAEAQARGFDARQLCETRRQTRDQAAADLGLEAFIGDLSALEDALARYGAAIAGLAPALSHHRAAASAADAASVRAEEARTELVDANERLLDLRGRAAARFAERDVLETSVGAAAEEILARLAEAQRESKAQTAALEDLRKEERRAHDERVLGQSAVERTAQALEIHETTRAVAAASLGRLAASRLLGVAVPSLAADVPATWSISRTVEVARVVESELERLDATDAAWERSGKGVFSHVQTLEQALLPQGHQATTTLEDELVIVAMPYGGRVHTMTEFNEVLVSEVTSRQTLLSAREREVIENHLVGEVSMHLHDRLHAAERLVREMNEELEARPMSTGMTLRFSWKPLDDGPPGLTEARRRLMRAGGTWAPAERDALGSFLAKRIADVRAANQTGSWQDHLAEALDYRGWHHFGVERQQDGVWKPLTRRTHGTGSGGEKAVALTLPLFAAAAAHYRSAGAKAPRLILLDEVFVGVDSDMRGKCMGLLATFDLDFVMTSEREWGCYASLPALAIYQLATRQGIDAIGVTRFVWNGRERLRAEVPAPGARAIEPTSPVEDAGPVLPSGGAA